MKSYSLGFAFVLILLLIVSSCNPFENSGISLDSYNPEIAMPLFFTTITVEELLDGYEDEGAEINADTDGALTLVYRNEAYSIDLADLFTVIPDIEFPLPDNHFVFPYELPNNISIDYILIKQGKIKYRIINPNTFNVDVTLRIAEIALDGDIFEETFTIGFLESTGEFDVTDYILTPSNDTLNIEYEAYKTSDGTEIDLDGLVGIEFQGFKHSYAQGYLGTGTYESPRDTIPVDFFDYFNSGTVYLDEPRMEVTIKNSFGFPVRMTFNILQAITNEGDVYPLSNSQLNAGIDFNYPTIPEAGQTKETFFVIDKDNSDLENMIGRAITGIDYEILPIANPDGDTAIIGFLTDTSAFSIDVVVELPLFGRAQNFTFSDTFDIDLSALDELNYADFKLVTENGFPMDVNMQVYMLDENDVLLDSLFNPGQVVMTAAPVNAEGEVTGTERHEAFSKVEESRFTNLRMNAKQAVLHNSFSTINQGTTSIRIFDHYKTTAKLGVIAGVKPE